MSIDSLLNFSAELDVALLDQAVAAFYTGRAAPDVQRGLVAFQDHPEAWARVDAILERSQSQNTKLLALNILDNCTKTRWRVLPVQQREGIKSFLISLIIRLSTTAESFKEHQAYLKRLNLSLVQILKQDWPHNWPNFITDLVTASKTNEVLCTNNMHILLLLSEEVFDYSSVDMTQEKVREMKTSLAREIGQIFELCFFVMENSQSAPLLTTTLEALLRYLSWIPVHFVMESTLIEILVLKYFPLSLFQNVALQCLGEIANLKFDEHPKCNEYTLKFHQAFVSIMDSVSKFLTAEVNVALVYKSGNNQVQEFIRYLSLFIVTFLKHHLHSLEQGTDQVKSSILQSLWFLLRISSVEDVVIFKICLEYWMVLVMDLYNTVKMQPSASPLMLGRFVPQQPSQRVAMYGQLLSQLRLTMIGRMAKPEEVLVVEDENGEIVRETMRDSDSINLYKSMRECLVYLTNLDPLGTQQQMLGKLSLQVDGSEYSWNNLNCLCWAVGSISGAMSIEQEKSFVVTVIKELLSLVEMKRGKDHKAIIAANIMYVVGQYPRFLRDHWRFLKTVVNKLIEFMHEKHPGVQDMACETFLKIAQKCKRKFVIKQDESDTRPFIEELLGSLPTIIQDLEPGQIHIVYESLGHIIQSQSEPNHRQQLLYALMELPNQSWTTVVTRAGQDMNSLFDQATVKMVISILKTNNRVAQAVGHGFIVQLGRIYLEMLQMYKMYSECISNEIASKGAVATQHVVVRNMRAVKKEALKLIETFVHNAQASDYESLIKNFVPALIDPVLGDYYRNHPNARDSEVLSLFATIINKIGSQMTEVVPKVFEALFPCTLQMITQNMQDFPDHRIRFFNLLRAINANAFRVFFQINQDQFKMVIDSVVWSFKHLETNIADAGLNTLLELLQNVERSDVVNQFYQQFCIPLLQDVFVVLTDLQHKPGFQLHASILAKMFSTVEKGLVTVPLWTDGQYPNNQVFMRQNLMQLIGNAFKNLSAADVQRFVEGLFALNSNIDAFRAHLRDFLVQFKEFSGDGLYQSERQQQAQRAEEIERERVLAVPGLMYTGPSAVLNNTYRATDNDNDEE